MIKRSIQLLFLLCSICAANFAYSQYYIPENSVWAMANFAGVDFSGGQPVPITSQVTGSECSAVLSDANGHLRFYTDGSTVWDRLGNVMPNGLNINNTGTSSLTTTQGALIVPHPGNPNQYFVFSMRLYLYVNLVDMSLNNGYGDIVTSYPLKGVINTDTMGEKMVALRGCNNNIWVVVRANNVPAFYTYQVNSTGLVTTPVISTIGIAPANSYFQGQMVVSPDGTMLATCSSSAQSSLELFKFDVASGVVYDSEVLKSNVSSYGLAFSPNGRRLYYSDFSNNFRAQQYNLDNHVSTDLGPARLGQFKLAVDGKVYFLGAHNTNTTNSYLGRIASPDLAGTACQFEQYVPSLAFPNPPVGISLLVGLPNEVVKVPAEGGFTPANRLLMDTVICTSTFNPIVLSAYPVFNNYIWDNGTTGLSRTVQSAGAYWVRYNTMCGPRTDTFKITVKPVAPLQLQYNHPVLSATQSYSSYQWYKAGQAIAGATAATLTVTDTGWYSLKVGGAGNCSDSAAYYVSGVNSIDDVAAADAIKVYPNPVKDQVSVQTDKQVNLALVDINGKVLKSARGNTMSLAAYSAGVYFIHITDARSGALLKVHKITKQ
ncbi:T9SS type A sorting domain-containing protein [Edaphocola aurantiacus]|uniref:T9SS type A sorting domain-containing protein n=1 Tax=Edaphocola aurantiacus TaxID=2601682 RepID=UPI001C982891|nr:T9SS type A sorting domain-containing protein [Edaphocola aurantiacus]